MISLLFIPNAQARQPSSFSFEIDDYYQDGYHAYYISEPGTKSVFPITIKNHGGPLEFSFHTTFGDQLNPPPEPQGVRTWFEPSSVFLKENEEAIINLVIELDDDVKETVYDLGFVGAWNEPNGFMGSSLRLHIGNYFGPYTSPNNFDILSPAQFFKETKRAEIVECKGPLRLVFKENGGSPSCVNFKSIQKLIDRGWAKSNISFLNIENLKPVYYGDEKISFSVNKIGQISCDWITIKVFSKSSNNNEIPLITKSSENVCYDLPDSNQRSFRYDADFSLDSAYSINLQSGSYVMQITSDGTAMDREFRIMEEP